MDLTVSRSLTFDRRDVVLFCQGDGMFFASGSTIYESAFLLANGLRIVVTNSAFDEAGCRNSLTHWGRLVSPPTCPSPATPSLGSRAAMG